MDFDNIGDLNEYGGDNPAFSNDEKEGLNRNADFKAYGDFLAKFGPAREQIPRDVKELKRRLVDGIFTDVLNSTYREKLKGVPAKVLVKIATPLVQPLWNYTTVYKGVYDDAEKQYRDIATGKKTYTPYDDFFDKYSKVSSYYSRLWHNSINEGARQVKKHIDSALSPSPAPSAPSPSPAPSAPSALDQFWEKHRSFQLTSVEQDVAIGLDAQQSLTDALHFLKAKVSGEDFGELFKRIANELGLVVEKEEKETKEAVEKSGSEAKEEAKARSKGKRELIKNFSEQFRKLGTGLNPYTEARARYYINKNVDGRALEAISTYNSIIQEFPNISLEAVAKVARERRMFFHPAYIQALYETNPGLAFQRKRSGQEYIDFHALSSDSTDDGTLDLKVAAENAKAQARKTSPKGRKTTPLDILKSFGRGGFFGAFESLGRYLFSNTEEERFQPVSSEEVANIIEGARQDIERATLEDGSVDPKKITDPNVWRLTNSSDYINTAYKIVLERRRSRASSVEPSSAQGLPRRTKKPWSFPTDPFRETREGFSFAFGAAKSGAHRVFDPVLKAAGRAWQAVKDDFNGVWGVGDEEFQAAIEEQRSRVSEYWENRRASDEYHKQRVQEAEEEFNELDGHRDELEDSVKIFGEPEEERWKKAKREYRKRRREWDKYKKRSSKEDARQRKSEKSFSDWETKFLERWKGGDAPQAPEPSPAPTAPSAPEPSPATSPKKPSESNAPSAPNVETNEAPKKPKWKVEATDSAGKPFTDVIEGDTSDEVIEELKSSGYKVEKIEPFKERKPAKRREAGGSPGSPSGSGDSSGDYELDPDGFTIHYKTKSGPAPGGSAPGGSPGSPAGAAVLTRIFGLIAALITLIAAVNKVKKMFDQMSSATHSFNDKFSQYNATISGYKLQQDAAAFKRDVKTAAEAARPYPGGASPQGVMTKASIEWEDSKAELASAWNRRTSPFKAFGMKVFSNLNEDLATVLDPKSAGDFASALSAPIFGNSLRDSSKERIASGIDKVIEKLTGIEGYAEESAKKREEEKNPQSGGIKASALLKAIETMGDLKATSGFMQSNSPSNNWTAGFKTEGQYGRDASSPSKKYGSGLTYHTRKE